MVQVTGILWKLYNGIRRSRGGERLRFEVYFVQSADEVEKPELVTLGSVCGPGDHGEPVLTVMLPGKTDLVVGEVELCVPWG